MSNDNMPISVTLSWTFKWDGVTKSFDEELKALKLAFEKANIGFCEVWFENYQYAGSHENESFADEMREQSGDLGIVEMEIGQEVKS